MFLVQKRFPSFALILCFVLSFPTVCSAQWVTESYSLKPGWNSIWLSHDCSSLSDDSTRPIGDVLAATPQIEEVWRWNPLGSAVQFTQSPGTPIAKDASWAVWRRGDPKNTTLGTLTGNSAYLVKVASTASSFTLRLTGKPLVPNYSFSSSGLNFLGFPTTASPPKFDTYFANSEELKTSPQIFQYVGGPLSDVLPKNPQLIVATRNAPVTRGRAYWVKGSSYSDFYGPLKVSVIGGGGIDFGRKLNTVTLRIKNVTDPAKGKSVTANFALASSEAAPGEFTIAPGVDMEVRGEIGPDLQFTRKSLAEFAVTLAPGEETVLTLAANRVTMNDADQNYASILSITDSLSHTRIDLPVTATGTTSSGVWVGAAVLDSVNRVETILEPEFEAPPEAPDSVGAEISSTETTTDTTQGGQTTRRILTSVTFDENNKAYLPKAYLSGSGDTVTVSRDIEGTETYSQGQDYDVESSDRGTITNRGSGYTEAPDVELVGGGGTNAKATAVLSAGVRNVKIKEVGSGYSSPPVVEFTGGGGSGASAIAIVDPDSGVVTEIRVTSGGKGYSEAPTVTLKGNDGDGFEAEATISGGIGSLRIDDSGSGYTGAPQVVFKRKNADETGVDASATVQFASGAVTGVGVITKTSNPDIGANAWVTLATTGPAVAGTPDGVKSSSVTTRRKLITLNGKSHYSVRRISTGADAAAPSLFPIRIILHAPPSGEPTLLQQLYLGQRAPEKSALPVSYAGPSEAAIAAIVTSPGPTAPGKLGRVSSASFPRGGMWTAAAGGSFGSSGAASFVVDLGHNAETNPFLHTYHPDHDNWDARYEGLLDPGDESYNVSRTITLTFSPEQPAGVSDLEWGVTAVGGTYSEIITGLRSEEIAVSGRFILHQVSEVPALTTR